MRRAAVLGGFVLVLMLAWVALRTPGDQWIVAVHADNGLMYEERCLPMDEVKESVATGGGEFNGLYKVTSRADGDAVAQCYEAHGVEAEVRTMTQSDRETWDEIRG